MNINLKWLMLSLACFLLSPGLSLAGDVKAKGDESRMDINISGTVTANVSCNFVQGGSGGLTAVDFGDIRLQTSTGGKKTLDGEYKKYLNGTFNCTGDPDATASMNFVSSDGTSTDYYNGRRLLPVSVAGKPSKELGIELLVNGSSVDVNKPFNINVNTPPKKLEVELLQVGDGQTLEGGANISAYATLYLIFD